MNQYKLTAQPRQVGASKGALGEVKDASLKSVKSLRRKGWIPANLIAKGKSVLFSFPEKNFEALANKGLRRSSIIELGIEGLSPAEVVIKEIQRSPVSNKILHVDFYRVTKGEQLAVKVGVECKGVSKGVKAGGALEQHIRFLQIRSVPEALQEVVEVDISDLELGDVVYLKDLKLPKEWELSLTGNPIILRVARARVMTETASTEEEENKAVPEDSTP